MPNIYSGVCLTAMFSAIIQEHRRLKGEAYKIKTRVEALALPRSGHPSARPARMPAGLTAGRS
jgi:hypothetical protein